MFVYVCRCVWDGYPWVAYAPGIFVFSSPLLHLFSIFSYICLAHEWDIFRVLKEGWLRREVRRVREKEMVENNEEEEEGKGAGVVRVEEAGGE